MKLRTIILALIYLCLPGRADAEGNSTFFKTPPCSGVPAIVFVAAPEKAALTPGPSQAKVLEHILKGKPCQMRGYTRYRGECYSARNLKLVKK